MSFYALFIIVCIQVKQAALDNADSEASRRQLETSFPVPFAISQSANNAKPFILCPHNQVAPQKYRSPFSNDIVYDAHKGEILSSSPASPMDPALVDLERKFNSVWEAYAQLYYGTSANDRDPTTTISSVYLSETPDGKFLGIFAIHKQVESSSPSCWNSYHVVQMDDPVDHACHYHVHSTVWVSLTPTYSASNSRTKNRTASTPTTMDASAIVTKTTARMMKIDTLALEASHLQNVGTIIEANEMELRSNLEQVHFPKTMDMGKTVLEKKTDTRSSSEAQTNQSLMEMIMDSSILKNAQTK